MVANIFVNYSCTRVLFYAKMLKETEAEETRLFCHIFIINGILIVGGTRAPCPPLATHVTTMIGLLNLLHNIRTR